MQSQNGFDIRRSMTSPLKILFLLVAAVLAVFLFYLFSESSSSVIAESDSIQVVDKAYEAEEWIPELPVRLVIPAINVDAPVQYVGLDETGTGEMGVPNNFTDVGWYKNGVRPGMRGSAVIAGHYNGKMTPKAVFYDLHTLEVGDEVVIMSANRIEDIFHVVKIETYAHDASTSDVFISTDGKKRLNLITCSGDWLPEVKLYDQRTVVFTELLTDIE
jgi:sortase A